MVAKVETEFSGGSLGLVVAEVDEQLQSRWGISGGVVVSRVLPGEPAEEGGIMRGDIITLVDSTPINSVEAYERADSKLKSGQSVPLRIIRRGSPLFIGVKLN